MAGVGDEIVFPPRIELLVINMMGIGAFIKYIMVIGGGAS
jgi:hypothetical protein